MLLPNIMNITLTMITMITRCKNINNIRNSNHNLAISKTQPNLRTPLLSPSPSWSPISPAINTTIAGRSLAPGTHSTGVDGTVEDRINIPCRVRGASEWVIEGVRTESRVVCHEGGRSPLARETCLERVAFSLAFCFFFYSFFFPFRSLSGIFYRLVELRPKGRIFFLFAFIG